MTLELQKYDIAWKQQFEVEKEKILVAVGSWVQAVEHIGSTSIPKLLAKPTIDIYHSRLIFRISCLFFFPLAALPSLVLCTHSTALGRLARKKNPGA